MKLTILLATLLSALWLTACSDMFIKPDASPTSPAMIPFEHK